jgi:hypothetical protein
MNLAHFTHPFSNGPDHHPNRDEAAPASNGSPGPSLVARISTPDGAGSAFAPTVRWFSRSVGDAGIGWHFRYSELPSDPELLAICEALSRYIG